MRKIVKARPSHRVHPAYPWSRFVTLNERSEHPHAVVIALFFGQRISEDFQCFDTKQPGF